VSQMVAAAAIGTTDGAVEVRLENLRREYGAVIALDGLNLTLAPGELVALLGPSGCGKTSALRLVAGLEEADAGRVVVAGKDVTTTPANKRGMGMVFQAYSLFPHMTARQNVAFGLRLRGVKDAERKKRAGDMLELVGLSAQADRFAHQMSGGQQQRVALARALAIRPQVLLLDEPLSALDAKVRVQLRDEIRRVQIEVGTTTLFVTHDQEEALAVADRVGVMRAGRLEQLGTPTAIYSQPETAFVAEFVGLTNKIPGIVSGGRVEVLGTSVPVVGQAVADGAVTALVRPEAIVLAGSDGAGVDASILAASFLGPISRLTVVLPDGSNLMAQLPTSMATTFTPGTAVRVSVRPDPVPVTTAAAPADSPS
jgi:putative spermidine/putrescine transport system ATP-binding protein